MNTCRICGKETLEVVFDLGNIYPSDFVKTQENLLKQPLRLVRCNYCDLVQLDSDYEIDKMYKEHYWYRSGLNNSMLKDLKDVVENAEKYVKLNDQDVVVDIGCNDGSLFSFYSKQNIIKIGFDPAPNLQKQAEKYCDFFINDYFSYNKYPLSQKAKVVTSIAMFYDLPDPNKFVEDVKNIIDPVDGIWIIQFTDLLSMFLINAFDNICHEHLEYYKLTDVTKLLSGHGFHVIDVSYNKVNGGSIRIIATQSKKFITNSSVILSIDKEDNYFEYEDFSEFKHRIKTEGEKLLKFLYNAKEKGQKVFVLGASTKGNTLLQYYGITKDLIPYAAEVNEDKFGLKTVGSDIEIISEKQALEMQPDYFLVLPWHFIDNIISKEWAKDFMNKGGGFIVPLPNFKVYQKDVKQKSVSELVDGLITASIKCFLAQDKLMDESLSEEDRLKAAVTAQQMNARRNMFMRALDERLDNDFLAPSEKTYG